MMGERSTVKAFLTASTRALLPQPIGEREDVLVSRFDILRKGGIILVSKTK
jgi:hypothetical protein